MQKKQVIILGFGGNSIDFFETVSHNYEIIGFVDDDETKKDLNYKGIKVYDRNFLAKHPNVKVISLIGSEKTYKLRHQIIDSFNLPKERFTNAIHPKAVVSEDAVIGHDVVIMAGVVVTSNAKIGSHIFILANTVVHHDVQIGDYTLLGSNISLAGHVIIGRNCFLGSSSCVKNNISIGDYSLVGMASNVVKNVPANSKVIGNPAKEI